MECDGLPSPCQGVTPLTTGSIIARAPFFNPNGRETLQLGLRLRPEPKHSYERATTCSTQNNLGYMLRWFKALLPVSEYPAREKEGE